jgi:amino acid transporter
MTAELATAFPENSGYVAWVTAAFGPMWGFQVGLMIDASQHNHAHADTSLVL